MDDGEYVVFFSIISTCWRHEVFPVKGLDLYNSRNTHFCIKRKINSMMVGDLCKCVGDVFRIGCASMCAKPKVYFCRPHSATDRARNFRHQEGPQTSTHSPIFVIGACWVSVERLKAKSTRCVMCAERVFPRSRLKEYAFKGSCTQLWTSGTRNTETKFTWGLSECVCASVLQGHFRLRSRSRGHEEWTGQESVSLIHEPEQQTLKQKEIEKL